MAVKKLPMFRGYVVDVRLRQFRKPSKKKIEFINFESNMGEKILVNYINSVNPQSKQFKEFIHYF